MAESSVKGMAANLADIASRYTPSDHHDPISTGSKLEMISLCKQIMLSLMDGGMMTGEHSLQMAELVSVRTLLGLGVFEQMPQEPGKTISLKELSEKSGVEDKLLERLLRVTVGSRFITQTAEGEYGHTKFSLAYLSYPGLFFKLMHDEFLAPMTEFPKYLKEHGPKEPTSLYENPYSDYFNASNTGLTTWDIMAKDPDRWKTFQNGLGISDLMVPTTGYFDFNVFDTDEPDRISLVDIGGGIGNKLKEILAHSPGLKPERCVLQDQEKTIAMSEQEKIVPGAKLMVHDFWKEQPVKGAKAYYIRRVLHDYSDADCIKILTQLRASMAPDSRVLIADQVLTNIITKPELEANVAVLDAAVLVMGGKQRTPKGFREILEQSGLELVKIWMAPLAPAGIVEAKIKGVQEVAL